MSLTRSILIAELSNFSKLTQGNYSLLKTLLIPQYVLLDIPAPSGWWSSIQSTLWMFHEASKTVINSYC